MRAEEFIAKWKHSDLNEDEGAKPHFIGLCQVLGVPEPSTTRADGYSFERHVKKTSGQRGYADVWKKGCFAWEYKSPGKDLREAMVQLKQYASDLENPPLLIVSDMRRIEIHTNWTNMVQEKHVLELEQLTDARLVQKLKWGFDSGTVDQLKPTRSANATTEQVAAEFVRIAQNLRDQKHDPEKVAHFVNRMVFCMFAEAVDLLPKKLFRRMLEASLARPHDFVDNAQHLFAAMATKGGIIDFQPIDWFNGGLFEDNSALPLTEQDIRIALEAAKQNWSEINPSIMGTLFERGLDPSKRSQLGAHYTDAEKIMMIVRPVIIEPLLREWAEVRGQIEAQFAKAKEAKEARPTGKTDPIRFYQGRRQVEEAAKREARRLMDEWIERLKNFRVLDPACGSGNFLYVALKELKNIELRTNFEFAEISREYDVPVGMFVPNVGPECVKGIEINPFAAELARVSVWIGEIQWMREKGFGVSKNPILKSLETIECRDALLNPDGTEAEWPEADVIIGNPPFLGSKFMRKGRPATKTAPAIIGLGDQYVEMLFKVYSGNPPASANFVSYWFAKGLAGLAQNACKRMGFVATQSVRLGASNKPIAQAVRSRSAKLFSASQNDEWPINGAEVRVSIFCIGLAEDDYQCVLDGKQVDKINADLTSGEDVVDACVLEENQDVAFQGVKQNGPFEIEASVARELLGSPQNVNGLKNERVVRKFVENDDVTMRDTDLWILDFTSFPSQEDAVMFELPFKHVRAVQEARSTRVVGASTETAKLDKFWLMQRPRHELRAAIASLARVIAVPETSEHRLFRFLPSNSVFSGSLFVIARDDDASFGCLHSRIHDVWATSQGNRLGAGNQRRYNASRTFETFPFPDGLTPNIPAADYANDPRAIAIAKAAARLNELRENWLNPPDLVQRVPEVVPGYPDRILPVDVAAAAILKKRTLTNLYNERPAWLDMAHKDLDAAVAAAYGWPADLSDDEILERLFKLNQERAATPGGTP